MLEYEEEEEFEDPSPVKLVSKICGEVEPSRNWSGNLPSLPVASPPDVKPVRSLSPVVPVCCAHTSQTARSLQTCQILNQQTSVEIPLHLKPSVEQPRNLHSTQSQPLNLRCTNEPLNLVVRGHGSQGADRSTSPADREACVVVPNSDLTNVIVIQPQCDTDSGIESVSSRSVKCETCHGLITDVKVEPEMDVKPRQMPRPPSPTMPVLQPEIPHPASTASAVLGGDGLQGPLPPITPTSCMPSDIYQEVLPPAGSTVKYPTGVLPPPGCTTGNPGETKPDVHHDCNCQCHANPDIKPDPDAPGVPDIAAVTKQPHTPTVPPAEEISLGVEIKQEPDMGHHTDAEPSSSKTIDASNTPNARDTAKVGDMSEARDTSEARNIPEAGNTSGCRNTAKDTNGDNSDNKEQPAVSSRNVSMKSMGGVRRPTKAFVSLESPKRPVIFLHRVEEEKEKTGKASKGGKKGRRDTDGGKHRLHDNEGTDIWWQRPKRQCTTNVSYTDLDLMPSDDNDEEYGPGVAPSPGADDDEGLGDDSNSNVTTSDNTETSPSNKKHKVGRDSGSSPGTYIPTFPSQHKFFDWLKNQGLECPCCGVEYLTLPSLRGHLEQHKTNMIACLKKEKYICELCAECIDDFPSLTHHKQEKHNINPPNIKAKNKERYLKASHAKVQAKVFAKWDRILCFIAQNNNTVTHKCSTCGESFKNATTLDMHKLLKHPTTMSSVSEKPCSSDTVYRCDICSKTFPSSKLLQEHCSYVHKNVPQITTEALQVKLEPKPRLQCTICKAEFLYERSLEEHMRIIHKGSRYQCDVCGEVLIEAKTMVEHRRMEHSTAPFIDPNKLLTHGEGAAVTGGVAVRCSICSKQFPSQVALDAHIKEHSDYCYVCDVCGISCASPDWVLKHRANRHPDAPRVHISALTKKVAMAMDNTKRGRKLKDPLKCTICYKEFDYRDAMGEHLMEVHDGMCYLCDICGMSTTRADVIITHRGSAHPGAPKIEPKKLLVKKCVEDPKLRLAGPLACSVCGKKLKDREGLKKHMEKHDNLCYVCDVCGMGYSGADWCMTHRLKRHPDAPHLEPEQLAKQVLQKAK